MSKALIKWNVYCILVSTAHLFNVLYLLMLFFWFTLYTTILVPVSMDCYRYLLASTHFRRRASIFRQKPNHQACLRRLIYHWSLCLPKSRCTSRLKKIEINSQLNNNYRSIHRFLLLKRRKTNSYSNLCHV